MKPRWPYILVLISWVVYAALGLLGPQTASASYHLSHAVTSLIQLSIFVPVLIIWLVAIQGATTFRDYAKMLKGSTESRAITLISQGLIWTLAYLVISSLLGALVPYLSGSSWLDVMIVIRNHLPAWVTLAAFWLIYQGSSQLSTVTPFRTWTPATIALLAGYGLFAAMLSNALLTATIPASGQGTPIYNLPRELLLFTMLLPYLLGWFLGLLGAINISRYARQVRGTLYRQALGYLVVGIMGVIGFAVTVQILTLATRFLLGFSLPRLLFTIYILLVLYGLGFWLVRLGARKLTRIEVVQ